MEHRQRRGVKWIAEFKACSQEFAGLRVGRCAIDCCPLWRQLISALKAPICITFRYRLSGLLWSYVLEKPFSDYFANLSFIICNQILGNASNNLVNLFLPLQVVVRHLNLAPRQADDRSGS